MCSTTLVVQAGDYRGNNILAESTSFPVEQSEVQYPEPFPAEEMRPVDLVYSNKQLNKAGQALISWVRDDGDEKFDRAYDKVYQLRLAHAYPLRAVTSILRKKALAVDADATVYSRSKRVVSIMRKLTRIPTMQLTTMQDIGGCRAVVSDVKDVLELVQQFRELKPGLEGSEEFDYIETPKPDGYRSFHFVVRFKSKNANYDNLPSRRIEVQLRSRLQHQWATALETIDFFTDQQLKAGGGRLIWRKFFVLAADLLAVKENCPRVSGSVTDIRELETDLHRMWDWLAIEEMMTKWETVVYRDIPINPGDNYNYLIETDLENRKTSVRAFPPEQSRESYTAYSLAEMANRSSTSRSAVLVSAYRMGDLREAFLSYYGDTTAFIATMKDTLGIHE